MQMAEQSKNVTPKAPNVTAGRWPDAYNINEVLAALKNDGIPAHIAIAWARGSTVGFRLERKGNKRTLDPYEIAEGWLKEQGLERGPRKKRSNETEPCVRCVAYLIGSRWSVWDEANVWAQTNRTPWNFHAPVQDVCDPMFLPICLQMPFGEPIQICGKLLHSAVDEAAELYCEAVSIFPDFEDIFSAVRDKPVEESREQQVAVLLHRVRREAVSALHYVCWPARLGSKWKALLDKPPMSPNPATFLRLGIFLGRWLSDVRALLLSAPYAPLIAWQGRSGQKLSVFWQWILEKYCDKDPRWILKNLPGIPFPPTGKPLKYRRGPGLDNSPSEVNGRTIFLPEGKTISANSFRTKFYKLRSKKRRLASAV